MAMKDIKDLEKWQQTLGVRAFGGGPRAESLNTPDDEYTQNQLVVSRRVIVLQNETRVRLLSEQKGIAHIRVAEGVNEGNEGMVSKYCLAKSVSGSSTLEPINQMPVYNPRVHQNAVASNVPIRVQSANTSNATAQELKQKVFFKMSPDEVIAVIGQPSQVVNPNNNYTTPRGESTGATW